MTDYFHLNAAPDTVRAISSLGPTWGTACLS